MKSWNEFNFSERLSIALYYGANRYIREYNEEQEKHHHRMATVDNALWLGGCVFRPRGRKKGK